ncbi:MAG TPA: hypothetical protein VGQ75_11265 [Thermoanaerobaculia bacterium]|nr:hypothetical protein [Thermoanaerobaculia bacterium]HEV8609553.1 hypothetical protein [Thermoanaerobaculia bacterium]
MPQTKMFRDRVVSMEQTFEGGEKHLELLKALCRDAFPDFEYAGHSLDHERDLFVIDLSARDGRRKRVGWTRMVLFDAERIPVLSGEPGGELRAKIVQYLHSRASRAEIVVTFRHLEEGWVDTPEPRRDRRRRRRGRGGDRGAAPDKAAARPRGGPPSGRERPARPGKPAPTLPSTPAAAAAPRSGERSPETGTRPDARRRFRRRRRRGRGSGGGTGPSSSA